MRAVGVPDGGIAVEDERFSRRWNSGTGMFGIRYERDVPGESDGERHVGVRRRWQRIAVHRHSTKSSDITGEKCLYRERAAAISKEGSVRAKSAEQSTVDVKDKRQTISGALESSGLARPDAPKGFRSWKPESGQSGQQSLEHRQSGQQPGDDSAGRRRQTRVDDGRIGLQRQ